MVDQLILALLSKCAFRMREIRRMLMGEQELPASSTGIFQQPPKNAMEKGGVAGSELQQMIASRKGSRDRPFLLPHLPPLCRRHRALSFVARQRQPLARLVRPEAQSKTLAGNSRSLMVAATSSASPNLKNLIYHTNPALKKETAPLASGKTASTRPSKRHGRRVGRTQSVTWS